MKRSLIAFCIGIVLSVTILGQQTGTPSQLRVLIDANGYLVTAATGAEPTAPLTSALFSNARLRTDANGNLVVTIDGGSSSLLPLQVAADGDPVINNDSGNPVLSVDTDGILSLPVGATLNSGGLGNTLVTNGTFTGSATGWTLTAGWAYGTNNVVHTVGTTTLSQNPLGGGAIIAGRTYYVEISQTAGSAGTATVTLGGTLFDTLEGVSGNQLYTLYLVATTTAGLIITPSNDYDGTLDNITVQLVPPYIPISWYLPYSTSTHQRYRWSAIQHEDSNAGLAGQAGNAAGDIWNSIFEFYSDGIDFNRPTYFEDPTNSDALITLTNPDETQWAITLQNLTYSTDNWGWYVTNGGDLRLDSPTLANALIIDPSGILTALESFNANYFSGLEDSEPSAPAANGFVIFAKDNGAGKTQLCVRFNTGASQCFATEP